MMQISLNQIMDIKLIIGLGNNDPEYTKTYHNVGFLMAGYLADKNLNIPIEKTTGFMNESGFSVREIIRRLGVVPENLLVIHDDSDIYLGDYKFSKERGSAGHKGVQNIMDVLKTDTFCRLRIGIRPKPKTENAPRIKAEKFVLKNISASNLKILNGVFERAAAEVEASLSH